MFAFLLTLGWLAVALVCAAPTKDTAWPHRVTLQRRQAGQYPPGFATAPPAMLPQAWRDALNAAQQAGKIPNFAPSTASPAGTTYANGGNSSPQVCSWTTMKCNGPNDVTKAADNTWMVAFDDGPTNASPDLYGFLSQQNQSATHFMIGSNILTNQAIAKQGASAGQQLAVHTWSHQLMTTLTTEEVLGELGWTMQIIYDLTGRVPNLWRPPQGDIDNRVRAVAEQVFGLRAVMWDAECNDWCLTASGGTACPTYAAQGQPGSTYQSVVDAVYKAIARPKSPGVILLEHELTPESVGIFKNAYANIKAAGWQTKAVSDALGVSWYNNAKGAFDAPTAVTGMALAQNDGSVPGASSSVSSTSTTSSSSSTSTSSSVPSSTSSSTTAAQPTSTVSTGVRLHTSAAASAYTLTLATLTLTLAASLAVVFM